MGEIVIQKSDRKRTVLLCFVVVVKVETFISMKNKTDTDVTLILKPAQFYCRV